MKPLNIKGTLIGDNKPKIIISVMGANADECIRVIEKGKAAGVELFEWRGDFHDDRRDSERMAYDARILAEVVPEHPLLFTFRSESQGGQDTLDPDEYVALNEVLIKSGALDIVDIETWIGDERVQHLVDLAHANNVYTIISYHNFAGTPSTEWMVNLMTHMLDLGADIPKVATIAHNAADAIRVLAATEEVHRLHTEGPLLTMAMGKEGSISRLAGAYFGSSITFCALEDASAPGQVEVERARRIIDDIDAVLS